MTIDTSTVLILALAGLAATGLIGFFGRRPRQRGGDTAWRLARIGTTPRGPGGTSPASPTRDTLLVMPDITGYTRFLHLNRFAEAHAQHIVTELLQAVISGAEPALTASKVEGDAVLLYAPMEGRSARSAGEIERALEELIRAFYYRREELKASNLCRCDACSHIGDLDIKAVVHRGPVTAYQLGTFTELSGLPVVAVHRLLKNSVDRPRYVLVTEQANDLVPSFARAPDICSEHRSDVGTLSCWVYPFEHEDLGGIPTITPMRRRPVGDLVAKMALNLRTLAEAVRDILRRPPTPRL
jgi:hypothetical protein